jgi:hypothetical protein
MTIVVPAKTDICDDCSLVAYDMGVEGWDAQVEVMVDLGRELPDHVCTARDEPELEIQCDCACRLD